MIFGKDKYILMNKEVDSGGNGMDEKDEGGKVLKKMPVGVIDLVFKNDIVIPKCTDKDALNLFRRYEYLFEKVASYSKEERIVKYKFIVGLALTSYAKKTLDKGLKERLFELKNKIFLSIINDSETRKKISIKYLRSKNFMVKKYCPKCEEENSKLENLKDSKKKFCKECTVDRSYYDVVSIYHKFDETGGFCLFLSKDRMNEIKFYKPKVKGVLKEGEEGVLSKYKYNVSNMDAFSLESVEELSNTLLTISPGVFNKIEFEKNGRGFRNDNGGRFGKKDGARFRKGGNKYGKGGGNKVRYSGNNNHGNNIGNNNHHNHYEGSSNDDGNKKD